MEDVSFLNSMPPRNIPDDAKSIIIASPVSSTIAKSSEGIEITIDVILNYELEREILGFGECITVIKPKKLRERIEGKLKRAVANYLMAGSDPE